MKTLETSLLVLGLTDDSGFLSETGDSLYLTIKSFIQFRVTLTAFSCVFNYLDMTTDIQADTVTLAYSLTRLHFLPTLLKSYCQ